MRPSGETAGEKSGVDFVGGEVKLRVSPLSVDNSARPSVTTHLPSGNQANKGLGQYGSGAGTSATEVLRAADGGDDNEGCTSFRHADKTDGASIRRKGRADVLSRVRGQPLGRRGANQLDVDIEVVLLLSVPGKGHLIAVRGKTRGPLRTRIAGEWDLLRVRLPVFWQSRERAMSVTAIATTTVAAAAQTQVRRVGRTAGGVPASVPESDSSFSSSSSTFTSSIC